MTRIPLATRASASNEDRAVFDRIDDRNGPVLDVLRVVANSPDVAVAMMALSAALRQSAGLPPALRELVVMYTCHLNGGCYEYAHHWNLALSVGVSRAQLDELPTFESSDLFDAVEKAALSLCRQLNDPPLMVRESTWSVLADQFEPRTLVDLVVTIGWYHLAARLTAAADVSIEPWYRKNASEPTSHD